MKRSEKSENRKNGIDKSSFYTNLRRKNEISQPAKAIQKSTLIDKVILVINDLSLFRGNCRYDLQPFQTL